MQIKFVPEQCASHGLCTEAAPAVFELDEDGLLRVLDEQPADEHRSAVETAAAACPTGAIQVL
jgi:ferredoxin